jgi:hypothetical protein
LRYRRDGHPSDLVGTAALVTAGAVATWVNLPINVKMREWEGVLPPGSEPELFKLRDRWQYGHLVRTLGGSIALLSFLRNCGTQKERRMKLGRPSRFIGLFDLPMTLLMIPATKEVVNHIGWLMGQRKKPEQG